MSTVILKRNDEGFKFTYNIKDEQGAIVDLTNTTVNLVIGDKTNVIINKPAIIESATNGTVSFTFSENDTLFDGNFLAEFVVTFSETKKLTYPRSGYILVNLQPNVDYGSSNISIDSIAAKQGDFENKLDQILAQSTDINEVIDSRGTYVTLGSRLNNIDTQLAEKASKKKTDAWIDLIDDFGAKGDGITDDTLAFQNAITAASGKVLVIPDPSNFYKITNEINLPNDITIIGIGNYPEIKQTTLNKKIFNGLTLQNINISGLRLTGYDTLNPQGDVGLIHILDSTNVKIKDNKISNTRNGIWTQNCDNVWIEGNVVSNFGFIGVCTSRSTNYYIDKNIIKDCTQTGANYAYGIQATGSNTADTIQEKCSISYNVIENIPSWDGIMTHSTKDLTISFNKIRNVRNGIDFSIVNAIDNLTVIGNECYGTDTNTWGDTSGMNAGIIFIGDSSIGAYINNIACAFNIVDNFSNFTNNTVGGGIALRDIKNTLITGNKISNIGTGSAYWGGISLNRRLYNVTIKDNHIVDSNVIGISNRIVYVAKNIIIKDNTITCTDGTMVDGIRVDSSCFIDSIVRDNKITGITNHIRRVDNIYSSVMPYCDRGSRTVNADHSVAELYSRQGYAFLDYRKDITSTGTGNLSAGTNLTVSSTTGITVNDVIHIQYLSGTDERYFSTKVNAVVDATNLTLANSLPADIPTNSPVYVVRWVNKIS